MIRDSHACRRRLASWVVASLLVVLAACSSGSNVPAAPSTADSGPVAVLPSTATVFSDVPTTFTVTGGSGNFLLASSDQNVIPTPGGFSGRTFTIVPNPVSADSPVTLTVRDAAGTTQATVAVTVRARIVGSTITIKPSAGQDPACGTSVCAGGDAEVTATLSQGGTVLVNRSVRFDVLSGDFRFITSAAGVTPETLVTSTVTNTDATGTARLRIRALPEAAAQTALLQITDSSTGAFQKASFSIAPPGGSVLGVQPTAVNFVGRDPSLCANGVSADVIVTGGHPPYSVTQVPGFTLSPLTVTSSGGRFVITATGQCTSSPVVVGVVDSTGERVALTVSNVPGVLREIALVVGPASITLDKPCSSVAVAIVAGGLGGPYFVVSGSDYLTANVTGNIISVRRSVTTGVLPTPPAASIPVSVTDGRQIATVSVNITPPAAPCTP